MVTVISSSVAEGADGAPGRDTDAVWRRFEAMMIARDAVGATPPTAPAAPAGGDARPSQSDATWARFETLLRQRDAAPDLAPEADADAGDMFEFTPAASPTAARAPARLFDLRAALRGAAVATAAILAAVAALDLVDRPAPAALTALAQPVVASGPAGRPTGPLAQAGVAAPSMRAPAPMTPPAAVAAMAGGTDARPSDIPFGAPPAPVAPAAPAAVAAIAAPPPVAAAFPRHALSALAFGDVEGRAVTVDRASPSPLPASAAGARVVLHHAADAGAQAAKAVAALQGAGLAAVALRTSPLSVSRTQIRYFHEGDRDAAQALHGVLRGALPADAVSVVADFTHYRPSPAPLAVEVWLASAVAG